MSATLRGTCPRRGTSRSMTTSPSRRRSWTPTSMTTTPAVLGTSVRSRRTCAFHRWAIAARPPRIGISGYVDEILGTPVAFPVLVAPWAYQGRAHPDGERGTVRGAATAGTIAVVSSTAVDDVEGHRGGERCAEMVAAVPVRGAEALRGHAARGVVGLSSHLLDGRFPGRGAPSSRHAERVRDALRSGRS